MTADRKTDAQLWKSLQEVDADLLSADAPVENADVVLRDVGLDPAKVGKSGAAFVAALAKKRRLSWQDRARDQLASMAARASRVVRLDLGGVELRAAVARARAAVGSEMVAAFRAHNDADMTEDELRELLADLEQVIALSGTGEDGENS